MSDNNITLKVISSVIMLMLKDLAQDLTYLKPFAHVPVSIRNMTLSLFLINNHVVKLQGGMEDSSKTQSIL
jgi:hypothetical protein